MKFSRLMLIGLSGLAAIGCDVLLEPAGTEPPPPPIPPPPFFEETEDDSDVPPDPFAAEKQDTTSEQYESDGLQSEDTAFVLPQAGTLLQTASTVTNLGAINVVPCAASHFQLTKTMAQIAKAEPAESPLNDNLSSRMVQPSIVNPVGGALALSVLRADFPGIVKLEPRKLLSEDSYVSGHCGATRIAENWFVTAAHCLDEKYDSIILKVGHEKLDGPVVEEIQADWTACHAAYSGQDGTLDNDIALVHIADAVLPALENVPIADVLRPQTKVTPTTHPFAMIAGWGVTSPAGKLSNMLLGTQVRVESIGPALIKVKAIDGKGPCMGDSGGPLFIRGDFGSPQLFGVLSGVEKSDGEVCTGEYVARYTNLQAYSRWINDVLETCTKNPTICVAQSDAS